MFSSLRKKRFADMTSDERRSYQTCKDRCHRAKTVCADSNIAELLGKHVAEMTGDEYAVFLDVAVDCADPSPCSLPQCVELGPRADSTLTADERDVRSWCEEECSRELPDYRPTPEQLRQKRAQIASAVVGAVLGVLACLVSWFIPRP